MPELTDQGRTFGVAVRARGEDTPLSVELGNRERGPSEFGMQRFSLGLFSENEEKRKKQREEEREFLSRPRPLDASLTVGLGLDRKTAELSRADLEALQALVDRTLEEARAQDLRVERYENERKEEKAS